MEREKTFIVMNLVRNFLLTLFWKGISKNFTQISNQSLQEMVRQALEISQLKKTQKESQKLKIPTLIQHFPVRDH